MKNSLRSALLIVCPALVFFVESARAQVPDLGSIHGNFQLDAQYYLPDSAIGAPEVPEKLLANGFANFIYERGNFSAGIRYENYTNALLGYDQRYRGNGIPFRYLNYRNDALEVTVGNFYEQFGTGLILRTYEERNLGYDNAFDGIRLKYRLADGLNLKGLIGYQRYYFEEGDGIVRALDAEWNLNESIKGWENHPTQYIIGASFVSKFQEDQDPIFILPENVATGGGRLTIIKNNLILTGEFAYKANDPSFTNNYIYKEGTATVLTATYSQKGIGFTFAAKRIDNMSFRSDRTATNNDLIINYLPAMTKNHTYALPALYPYATQSNGEYGFQAEFFLKLKPETKLGGTNGTDVTINYSRASAIDKEPTGDDLGYTSEFFKTGNEVYFEDFNIELHRKWNKKVESKLNYVYINYNQDVIEVHPGVPNVYSHTVVLENVFKLDSKKSIRMELQHLYTKQDRQSWAFALAEYSISPHWFFAAFDQYNYGNDITEDRIHYVTASAGFTKGTNRIQFGYGRQRSGILCVGGVCRQVPASNGFTLSVTSSF